MNGLALCAGYGGLELGIERVFDEYRTVCFVEGEMFAAQHLIKKMEEGRLHNAPIWSNVRTFNGEPWRGKLDIISGGFPCQPYSSAGKQMAEHDPRDLWPDFVRIVGEVLPGFIFFENVPGIVKWRLNQIILDLDKIGYSCSWGIVGASDVGAPHQRKRWFLFGVRNSNGNGFIEPSYAKHSERVIERGQMERHGIETNGSIDTNANHPGERAGGGTIRQKNGNDISRLCSNVSNTYGLGRDKVKSNSWRGKLDVEGVSLNISNPKSQRSPRIERFNETSQKIRQGEGNFDPGDKWGGGFESWWEIEPSMGRLVDGASDWVDKLRLLGNGVVPQQAAYALQTLGERLAWGMVENRTPKL